MGMRYNISFHHIFICLIFIVTSFSISIYAGLTYDQIDRLMTTEEISLAHKRVLYDLRAIECPTDNPDRSSEDVGEESGDAVSFEDVYKGIEGDRYGHPISKRALFNLLALYDSKTIIESFFTNVPLLDVNKFYDDLISNFPKEKDRYFRVAHSQPLYFAICQGRHTMVEFIIDNIENIGVDEYLTEPRLRERKITPLGLACWKGKTEVVKTLLSKGADIKKCGEIVEWDKGDVSYVSDEDDAYQISLGNNNYYRFSGKNRMPSLGISRYSYHPINYVLVNWENILYDKKNDEKGYKELLQLLIQKDKEFVSRKNMAGYTPIFIAAASGNSLGIDVLINNGADVNDRHEACSECFQCQIYDFERGALSD